MEKNKRIYWIITVAISLYILFTAYFSYMKKDILIEQFGYPNYFRIELIIAKIIGAVALLIPQTPPRLREWVYAGFSICMVSAAIAHFNGGDPVYMVILPLVEFVIFLFGVQYLHKQDKAYHAKEQVS